MIKSMTGYGCAKGSSCGINVTIELRSVNNRFLDCSVRIPRVYTSMEDSLKSLVGKHISRGKVDVFVTLDSSENENMTVNVNTALAEAYLKAIESMAHSYNLSCDLSAISLARMQDVLTVTKEEANTDSLSSDLCTILDTALVGFDSMRSTEGLRLYQDISLRLDAIENLTNQAEERSPVTVAAYRDRLYSRMQEILQDKNIDENRILLEAAIFADKVAVNEEIVRLRSHVSQLRQMLDSDEPVGRKIDFLVQEMNREANTLGSKGNDYNMARIVIDLKAEIEKIREQIQNVE